MSEQLIRRRPQARLGCGTTLMFETATFLPQVGERVPCVRHSFCTVEAVQVSVPSGQTSHSLGRGGRDHPGGPDRRARRSRREVQDVEAFVAQHPSATTDDLRRANFSLRLIAEAQASGVLAGARAAGRGLRPGDDIPRH